MKVHFLQKFRPFCWVTEITPYSGTPKLWTTVATVQWCLICLYIVQFKHILTSSKVKVQLTKVTIGAAGLFAGGDRDSDPHTRQWVRINVGTVYGKKCHGSVNRLVTSLFLVVPPQEVYGSLKGGIALWGVSWYQQNIFTFCVW